MFHDRIFLKRICTYLGGLFILSFGVVLSIQAGFGVSPVSSLAYAGALITPFSVGTMVVITNLFFIALQVLLGSKITLKECLIQLSTSLLFCVFIDAELYFIRDILPATADIWIRILYLLASTLLVACALTLYLTPGFSPLSYDAMTNALAQRIKWPFGKAKVMCDLLNVCLSASLCLIFIHQLGSIGLGTLFAAYAIGKLAGLLMGRYGARLHAWLYRID